jgi:hypothetical protein
MFGDSFLASPTTAASDTTSSIRLVSATARDGGAACSSSASVPAGRK